MPSSHGNAQKHESKNPLQRALIAHFHRSLADAVSSIAPREILDVGCGEGYVLRALRDRGVRCPMTGIDLSESAIHKAQQRVPEASFAVADALELAQRGKKYDLVLMIEVLEHIPNPERMLPVLQKLSGCALIVSVPWEPFFRGLNFMRGKHMRALGNDPEHVNHWGRRGFLRFVDRGFRVRETKLTFPWTLVTAEPRV